MTTKKPAVVKPTKEKPVRELEILDPIPEDESTTELIMDLEIPHEKFAKLTAFTLYCELLRKRYKDKKLQVGEISATWTLQDKEWWGQQFADAKIAHWYQYAEEPSDGEDGEDGEKEEEEEEEEVAPPPKKVKQDKKKAAPKKSATVGKK
eukprot:TRINITY_DN3429_c0_g1_i1.p1 TRINITY_DN3429_c0_g1~~TRINITY_DN3429_c0_g1_i1.p1  ORF type:complete len:150 (+),score=51.74 TRINITY_DN3429_c0_g1_i1:173-622(+)